MFNSKELEVWAQRAYGPQEPTEAERLRLDFIREMDAERRPLRARLGAAFVRLGRRLDPVTSAAEAAATHDILTEGRLAAYLR